jgi:hypothetical protein
MGDAGSLTLGFTLAVIGIKLRFIHYPLASTWMAPIVVLGVLIFDTMLVSLSRLRRGRSIFQGGSDHTSHRLVQIGMSQPRAVLTLYITAAALGTAALFMVKASPPIADGAFAALVLAGVVALQLFERVEPHLTGDPPLVLIPGGGGCVEAVRVATRLSREVLLLLAPRTVAGQVQPSRAEVIDAVTAMAEDPAAVRPLLEQGLGQDWWVSVNQLDQALRLNGHVRLALPAPNAHYTLEGNVPPEILAALLRAQLILLGPGDPETNLIPALVAPGLRQALLGSRGSRLWVGAEAGRAALEAWLGQQTTATPTERWESDVQARLLQVAAAHIKSQVG